MIIDAITNTYKQHNEDAYGHGVNFAWVIDGALPLDKTNVTPWTNDVTWVGNWWTKYLNTHLQDASMSIQEHLQRGVLKLNEEFKQFAPIDSLSKLDRASFSIGITRLVNEWIECYVLGDIELVLKFKNDLYQTIVDDKIEILDRQVINMIVENPNRENEIVFNGYTAKELEVLRSNRMKMNSSEGYYILEHDPMVIEKGRYQRFALHDLASMMLMSDGFSAIHNKYKLYSLETLFEKVRLKSVDDIIPILRKKELDDFKTCHRLRKHDDATAVYIEFNE